MHYKNNNLTQVVFQLNFNIIEALKKGLNSELEEICQQITGQPKVEQEILNVLNITIQQVGIAPPIANEKTKVWIFPGTEFRIQLQNGFLNISALHYSNHEIFHESIDMVVRKLISLYNPWVIRISLRYINNLIFKDGSTFDFKDLINQSLLSPTLDFIDEDLTRSIGIMSIRDEEDINVNFTYGFLNSQFPNKIAKREFVLDYDCILIPNSNINEIKPQLQKLRNKANHLFEKSILQDLKDLMQPIN